MDISLAFEQKSDYLYVSVIGSEDNGSLWVDLLDQIHARAVELSVKKILIEEEFPNQISTIDMYNVAEHFARLFGRTIRVAHVDRRLADLDLNKFGEDVAFNRGADVAVFDNVQDAENWLIS